MTNILASIAVRLESIIGSSHVFADSTSCAAYAVDELIPSTVAKPTSAEQVAEIVRFASLEKLALIPCGNRTKLALGMPPTRYDIALDMTALNQIPHYDPGDLTVSADAGAPLTKLNAALSEHNQFLPLLVPWYSRGTIAGTIASGLHSPLQHFYGTARDFLIGAEFVTGSGALTKSGGRVVKNVTGYDLHKLLVGSLGSLAVITRLNFRTFPAPIAGSRGFVASFPNAEGALALRRAIAKSLLTPLTHDILSPELAQIFATQTPATPETAVFAGENHSVTPTSLPPIGNWFSSREWQLCAAFASPPEVLTRYARELTLLAERSRATSTAIPDDDTRPALWGRLRESLSLLLGASPATVIFKISVLPSHHARLFASLRQIADHAAFPHALVARAGGTIYFALLPTSTGDKTAMRLAHAATRIFNSVSAAGGPAPTNRGSATLLFAPLALKQRISIREQQPVAPASSRPSTNSHADQAPGIALMRRLKAAFDPQNILAPGRYTGGI
jgi:glycolate oxidase FAD binding subunit